MATEKLDTRTRREQIAKAALKVIAGGGFDALNIAAVAEEVGLVPSAIYRHFSGRDEIVKAALRLVGRGLLDNVRQAREEARRAPDRLRRLLDRHVEMILGNPGIPRLIFSEEVYANSGHRETIHGSIRAYLAEVALLVREGQTAGDLRPDLDPDTISVMFLGLVQPAAILWQMSDGQFDFRGHAERAWGVLLYALDPCYPNSTNPPGLSSPPIGENMADTPTARR